MEKDTDLSDVGQPSVITSGTTTGRLKIECWDKGNNSLKTRLPTSEINPEASMPTIFEDEDVSKGEESNIDCDPTLTVESDLDGELSFMIEESDLEVMAKECDLKVVAEESDLGVMAEEIEPEEISKRNHLNLDLAPEFAESDFNETLDEVPLDYSSSFASESIGSGPEDHEDYEEWICEEETLAKENNVPVVEEEPYWITNVDLELMYGFSYDAKMSCGNPLCSSQEPKRVCHHPECVEGTSGGKCLLLCKECDTTIHRQPGYSGHLVLDMPLATRSEFVKRGRSKTEIEYPSDQEDPPPEYSIVEDILEEDHVDGLGITKSNSSSSRSSGVERRLRRKDAVKRKSSYGNANDRARSKSLSAMEIQADVYLLEPPRYQTPEQIVPSSGHRHLSLPGGSPGNGFLQVFLDPSEESVRITALKGKSIQELLSPQLEHHNIDISSVNIYLESSHTPLPMNSDAGYLEGTNLYVKAKDGSPEVSPLALTHSVKEKDNKRIPSIVITKNRRSNNLSADESSLSQKGGRPLFTSAKQKDKEKLDTMLEVLKNTVTQQPPAAILELEESWRNIVANSTELPKEVQSQQEVIWELLCTEAAYIESLKVITDLFMCCLRNVQDKLPAIMKEIECDKLFSNIVDVINSNSTLWKDYLSQMLQVSRETQMPLDPSLMKEGFKKFPELFHPYQRFCAEQMVCQNYIKEKLKSNEYFKNFVTWAEGNTNLCRRLRLIDIIITPMQRLTRYSLLLRRIKEKSTSEEQKEDLQEMIKTVDTFVSYVNLVVGQRREQEKLSAMASRIDSYEAVDAPNDECLKYLQHYNANFNLMSPMPGCGFEQNRIMVHHANLKYKDAATRLDVECYIFTDLFLICKSKKVNERLKVLKPPIRINRISVKELKDKGSILVIQLNEYDTPQMAFTLQSDPSVIKIWLDKLHQARDMYNVALQAASNHRQQLNVENEESEETIETVPKNYQLSFPLFYGRADTPCISPKLSQKDRPSSLTSLHKHKNRTSSTSEHSVSPMIVCQSPSPEHLNETGLPISNTEMKTSPSGSPNLPWNNSAIGEELKGKVDRNRKTEKRYFTADSIQELKRQEQGDNSIHKRLSWNLGSVRNEGKILSKHMSSDSIPSSSGVSSTGSSHLSPDHEGNENEETAEVETQRQSSLLETRASNNSLSLNTDSRSKSMSDIALLLQDVSPSEMKDGISSVDLPREINYQGLTQAQILNIKKYLLLNTTNESEV